MTGLEEIKTIPEFRAEIDNLLLAEFRKKSPEIAHVLERISVENARGAWMVQRIVELNNSYVGGVNAQSEANELLRQIVVSQEELAKQLAQVQQQSEANAQTILDWTVKFKSPLVLLGALIGIIITAAAGAWITSLFPGPPK